MRVGGVAAFYTGSHTTNHVPHCYATRSPNNQNAAILANCAHSACANTHASKPSLIHTPSAETSPVSIAKLETPCQSRWPNASAKASKPSYRRRVRRLYAVRCLRLLVRGIVREVLIVRDVRNVRDVRDLSVRDVRNVRERETRGCGL